MAFEFIRDGVLYQVQTLVGAGRTVVDVQEQDSREPVDMEACEEVAS